MELPKEKSFNTRGRRMKWLSQPGLLTQRDRRWLEVLYRDNPDGRELLRKWVSQEPLRAEDVKMLERDKMNGRIKR